MTIKFKAIVKKGKLELDNPVGWQVYLNENEGKWVDIEIGPHKKSTTNQQYGYLFGVVFPVIANITGHTIREIEYIYKMKFHFEVVDYYGQALRIPKSISRAKSHRKELSDLIDKIIMDAAQNGIYIPPPPTETENDDY